MCMRPKDLADLGFADITPPEIAKPQRTFPKEFYEFAKKLYQIDRKEIVKEFFFERITFEEFKKKAEEILSSQPTNNSTL